MNDLFENSQETMAYEHRPLAELMRPERLDDLVGQDHILNQESLLFNCLRKKKFGSFIFYGPPGVGKTTIARVIAAELGFHLIELKATETGLSELRNEFEAAKLRLKSGTRTVIYIDEIHRFTKSQQDSFLPYVENGIINLIATTTENPNFEINSSLLSRVVILELFPLDIENLNKILSEAERFLKKQFPASKEGRQLVLNQANGDVRVLLNIAEIIFESSKEVTVDQILDLALIKAQHFSKLGDQHYDYASALQKSIRGSNVNAALYWLARMLNARENPNYILRRILRTSYEDIGLSDITAQEICLNAANMFERVGSPEGEIALAQAVIYLSLAPKSNSVYLALQRATKSASETSHLAVPKPLRTSNNYIKNRNVPINSFVDEDERDTGFDAYLPNKLGTQYFYEPKNLGDERELVKRLDYFQNLRRSSHMKND